MNRKVQVLKTFTKALDSHNIKGCRITPNVITNTKELDSIVNTLIESTRK